MTGSEATGQEGREGQESEQPLPWWIRCTCPLTERRDGGLKRDWTYPVTPGCPIHDYGSAVSP